MKLAIGTKVQVETLWAQGCSPDWIGGYKIVEYPINMPSLVKVERTRGVCNGVSIVVDISKIRADDQRL